MTVLRKAHCVNYTNTQSKVSMAPEAHLFILAQGHQPAWGSAQHLGAPGMSCREPPASPWRRVTKQPPPQHPVELVESAPRRRPLGARMAEPGPEDACPSQYGNKRRPSKPADPASWPGEVRGRGLSWSWGT